jgi:hypothetical protein
MTQAHAITDGETLGVSARSNAPSHAGSVTAAVCISGLRNVSRGISTRPPAFVSSRRDPRDRARQRHSDDGDRWRIRALLAFAYASPCAAFGVN